MGDVIRRPVLSLLEIGWGWLVGIPFLLVCWQQAQKILAVYPLDASGFNNIDTQNPWVAFVQLGSVWDYYAPHVVPVLHWLLPVFAVAWILVSAIGRNLILMRMKSDIRFRPLSMIALHAVWLGSAALAIWGWFASLQWTATTHFPAGVEPDLVGFFIWAIFISLGFFSGFALLSWPFSIAPVLMLTEDRSVASSLIEGMRLGKGFSSKLAEINLVMGIVKLGLIVLAMVLSAAPLPFADELSPGALRIVTASSAVFYLLASDYFQVVRLRAFLEFRELFRGNAQTAK
jgi:hypothetical protein